MGQEENWDAYLWPSDDGPGARMLRNNYGLHNRAALTQREYDATSKREVQLVIGQVKLPQTRDAAHLKALHRILFQDVYEWLGLRTMTVWMRCGRRSRGRPPKPCAPHRSWVTPHARSRPGNKTMGAARTTGGNGTGGRCDGDGGR